MEMPDDEQHTDTESVLSGTEGGRFLVLQSDFGVPILCDRRLSD
jgi:hypothetical protein